MIRAVVFLFGILGATTAFASAKKEGMLPTNAFIELAKKVNPAVVNISTETLPNRMGRNRDPFFDMLEEFYGFRVPTQRRPQTALGTGFIIREEGLIITNNHVIAGADVINVQLSDDTSKKYQAKVVGSDERTDIALIRIEGRKFPTVKLGSSASTEVGEWVAAFGNPFGNGHTMTKGIISAKGRDIDEINRFPLLQTDAPINPGNSGGPLVNLDGEVIGVNAAIDARAQGIGFAIPIDEVKSILPQLEKTGRIAVGFLGVGLDNLTPESAAALGINAKEGALILQVDPGTPADKAGLQNYDVIVEAGGRKITNASELRRMVASTTIGGTLNLKVLRDGKTIDIRATIGARPDQAQNNTRNQRENRRGQNAPHSVGFQVADLTPQLREQFEIAADVRQPVVVQVTPGSPAATAGLLPGDVVFDVNRKRVKNAAELLREVKPGTNTLRVVRQGMTLFLVLRTQ